MKSLESSERKYLLPEAPIQLNGKSPLAKLQEICKNIGTDSKTDKLTGVSRETTSKLDCSSNLCRLAADKSQAAQLSKSEKTRKPVTQTATKTSPVHPVSRTETGGSKDDLLKNHDHQLHCQWMLYQTELERLKMAASVANLISQPMSPERQPPVLSPPPPPPPTHTTHNALVAARLANLFYNKLNNITPSMSAAIQKEESLLNTGIMFNPFLQNTIPTPTFEPPRLHHCQWVTSTGFCGRSFPSNEELMLHLRSHVCSNIDSVSAFTPHFCRTQLANDNMLTKATFSNTTSRYHPYFSHRAVEQLYH